MFVRCVVSGFTVQVLYVFAPNVVKVMNTDVEYVLVGVLASFAAVLAVAAFALGLAGGV